MILMYGEWRARQRWAGFFGLVSLLSCLLLPASVALPAQSADVAAKSHQAKQAMSEGRFEEAVSLYQELARAHPDDAGFVLDLGLALHSAGRYREAVQRFEAYLNRQPDPGPVWLLLGLDYQKLGEPEHAVEPLERALRAGPGNRTVGLELAQALLSVGRPDEAESRLLQLTRLHPEFAEAWQALGLIYVALARRAFEELEKLAPNSAYYDVLLARSLIERNQYYLGFHTYKDALAKDPQLRAVYEGLAEAYRRAGHADWALTEENRERHLPPPDCSAHKFQCVFLAGNYGELVELTRRSKTAESLYWQAWGYSRLSLQAFARLAQMPPSPAIHDLLAEAYRIQGKYELCVKEWQEALKLVPDDRRQKEGLARAFWLNREYDQAQPLLEELIRAEPESVALNYELGDALLRGQDAAGKAIPFLEKAARLAPDDQAVHASLGRAYMRAGEPEKAIPHFNAALGLDEEGTLYYQLAQAYQKVGQRDLAKQTMQKFQEISKAAEARKPQRLEEYQITPP
jgi:predicted Zn-dependent protease